MGLFEDIQGRSKNAVYLAADGRAETEVELELKQPATN
jgi:hypothetical protein